MNPKGRSLSKTPNIHNTYEERKIWCYRPPPKPPNIQNVNEEVIGILEKDNLPYMDPEDRPPLKPPKTQDYAEDRIWPPPKPPNMKNAEEKERKT